jgi:hypothetical protein
MRARKGQKKHRKNRDRKKPSRARRKPPASSAVLIRRPSVTDGLLPPNENIQKHSDKTYRDTELPFRHYVRCNGIDLPKRASAKS